MLSADKYLAEFLGTLFFVICILASGGYFIVIGLSLAVVIYLTGSISGGHINPAVSFAMYFNKKLSLNDFGGYVFAQLLGAVTSVYLYNMVLKM